MQKLSSSYVGLPDRFYARVNPARAPAPRLLVWNTELAAALGLDYLQDEPERLADWFSGNELLPGAQPMALAYAGHQFGNFVPQLGDGRALLLGELALDGRRVDVQLKGSGQTPFSRRGDGKAAIGPVIREYLVSEAMHSLGVPTTRSLAAVATGEWVQREERLPGAVLTRVASSHIRVGTFEYFAARRDREGLQALADFAIARHYPEAAGQEHPLVAFFAGVVEAQAKLVAHWLDVGFIHGVMNTDNMAVSGETIDYGPCAFMDEFDSQQVFSSIDRFGRYAYGRQAPIAHWNLARLAECLMLLGDPQTLFEEQLARFQVLFEDLYLQRMARKIGLQRVENGDERLVSEWLQYLHDHQLDYTLSHRRLASRVDAQGPAEFGCFESSWRQRLQSQGLPAEELRVAINAVNPLYIPRNHLVQRAIDAAVDGDPSVFEELDRVLKRPFDEQPGLADDYAEPPQPAERVTETFCGT